MVAIKNTWYELVETSHYIIFYEHFKSSEEEYRTKIAQVGIWKRDVIKKLLRRFNLFFENSKVEIHDIIIAMRIYLAMKVLSSIKRPELKYKLIDVVSTIPDEEVLFWAWKVSSNGRGTSAFKVLYELS